MTTLTNIVFMRHGRSLADDERVYEGRYDSPLTEVGREQAYRRAEIWRTEGIKFDCIIASPLRRTHTTAEIVSQVLGIPIEVDPNWIERNNGPLAGLNRDIADLQYPKAPFRNPYEPFLQTGESEWQVYCRAVKAVETIVQRGIGFYLVISHGGILNAAIRSILGVQPQPSNQGIWFQFDDMGYAVTSYNHRQHLWTLHELRST